MNTVLKVKNKMVVWEQMVIRVSVVYPCDRMADWGGVAHYCCLASQGSTVPCITNPGEKNQNSKFKVWFLLNAYFFHTTIKLKKS